MDRRALIIHIPHSSVYIPEEERVQLLLTEEECQQELLALTDRYVDELFDFEGVKRQVSNVSRLVFDPERFREDEKEVIASVGMGAIYTKTSTGKKLREISPATREAMLKKYYDPYHREISKRVEECLAQYGQCLIIDAHSFSANPLPHEPDQSIPRPAICIGTDPFHTPSGLEELAYRWPLWEDIGQVACNSPFKATFVPTAYYQSDRRVKSIMIEVNRSLYMNERTGEKLDSFSRLKEKLDLFTGYILDEV